MARDVDPYQARVLDKPDGGVQVKFGHKFPVDMPDRLTAVKVAQLLEYAYFQGRKEVQDGIKALLGVESE